MSVDERISGEPSSSRLPNLAFWAALVGFYLFSRLTALRGIPLFIDEAIHVDWAHPSTQTFMPLDPSFDGKWLSIKLFVFAIGLPLPLDRVIAARLTVVILGLATAFGCYLIGRDLFSRLGGAIGAVLYVVLPFTVIYNSLALSDGIQLAFATWAIFAAVRVVRSARWIWAAIALPILIAAAILSKFSTLALIALPIIAVLLLMRPVAWGRGALRIAPALITTFTMAWWLYYRGLLEVFKTKTAVNLGDTRNLIWQNFSLAGEWLWGLLTPSIAILAIVSLLWLMVRVANRAAWFVAALLCLTVLPYVVFARIWYPRYLLLAVIPIVLVIAGATSNAIGSLNKYRQSRPQLMRLTLVPAAIAIISWPVARSAYIMFDLADANLPAMEQYQLVSGWPSGYGLPELVTFLREQAKATPGGVMVVRTVASDHPLNSLNIYLEGARSLSLFTMSDYDPGHAGFLARVSSDRRMLLVLTTSEGQDRIRDATKPLLQCGKPIWSFTRPKNMSGLVVYELVCDDAQIKAIRSANGDAGH